MKRSLAFKLYSSIAVLIIIIFASITYTIFMINITQDYANETGDDWLPSLIASEDIHSYFILYSKRELNVILQKNPEKRKAELKLLEVTRNSVENGFKKFGPLINTIEEKENFPILTTIWKEYTAISENALKLSEQGRDREAYEKIENNARPLLLKSNEILEKLVHANELGAINSTKKGSYLTNVTNITMASLAITAIIIGIIIYQIVKKSINSIKDSVKSLKKQSVTTKEIASSLKGGAQSLSDSITEQAASVHETSAAVNEISSMVNRTAENARGSTEVAKTASTQTTEGETTMKQLAATMETIKDSSDQLQNISQIITQINAKTAVINDIVSKTELLSLNASIESARAGEYGKGFAVVAEEVGNLAKVSGKAAHEIQTLITASQEQVNKIIDLTKARVADGKKVTVKLQECFQNIADNISNLSSVIQQISAATHEQEIGVKQISTAMSQIDRVTQTSQSIVVTTTESSKSLLAQSESLDSTTQNIEVLIMGSK